MRIILIHPQPDKVGNSVRFLRELIGINHIHQDVSEYALLLGVRRINENNKRRFDWTIQNTNTVC